MKKIFLILLIIMFSITPVLAVTDLFRPELSDEFDTSPWNSNIWRFSSECPQLGETDQGDPTYSWQCTGSNMGTHTSTSTNDTGAGVLILRQVTSPAVSASFFSSKNQLF